MDDQDIHLAAASIGVDSRRHFESVGFVEDRFCDCRNCSASIYHATYRGDIAIFDESFWASLCNSLKGDPDFNGLLEHEHVVRASYVPLPAVSASVIIPLPLPSQSCPSDCHKACDVHIAVKINAAADLPESWLDGLCIASFRKSRHDGDWRIYTATFDTFRAGETFVDIVSTHIPLTPDTVVRIKLERIVHAFRYPADAITLPLTYADQLHVWVNAIRAAQRT